MPSRGRRQTLVEISREQVVAREIGRALSVIPPWLGWLAILPLAVVLHAAWPTWWGAAVIGAASGLCAAGEWKLTHRRKTAHARWMPPATVAACGAWLIAADLAGLRSAVMLVWFVAGGALAWHWASWLHSHGHDDGNDFATMFGKAAQRAGVDGVRVLQSDTIEDDGTLSLAGDLAHPGLLADDVAKELPYVEASAGLPPGTLKVTGDRTHAGRSHITATNPLLLDQAQPWPGPSAPGASIAAPIRPGRYANGRPLAVVVVNHSVQVMGMSGSGKSFGWLWNEAAEQFTRPDAAMMAADVIKADQTLGPLRQGLHRVELTRDGIAAMLEGVHRAIPARTQWLADRGLGRWAPGCGLTHLTVALEEAPDIVDLLDDKDLIRDWLSDVKAIRSAGGRWIISLQRSTFDQMPTIVRSQLARVCFGLADDDDEDYGLTPLQNRRNCHPAAWGVDHPGRCFVGAPGIPEDLTLLDARTYAWGDPAKDGGVAGAAMMRAHCARYPAAGRELDDVTAAAFDPPVSATSAGPLRSAPPPPQEAPVDPAAADPDADPGAALDDDLAHAGEGPPVEVDPDADWDFGDDDDSGGDRPAMTAEDATAAIEAKLTRMRAEGVLSFGLDLWADVLEETGRSDAWLYGQMARLEGEGQIKRRDTRPRTWQLGRRAA